jgi:hypothetical protein
MTDAELIRLNPSQQNAGGISDQTHQGNPSCNLAKNLLSKNPSAYI